VGFAPTLVRDDADGLDKARQCGPDVILYDTTTSGTDGGGLCRALRADKELRETPIPFVTALRTGGDSVAEPVAAEVDDVL
jgi:CheY-like chemotaxis protein